VLVKAQENERRVLGGHKRSFGKDKGTEPLNMKRQKLKRKSMTARRE
jgi:hypothetical protein